MRSFLRFFAPFASVALAVVAAACSDSSSSPVTPLDPPRLRIDSIDAAGAPQWVPGRCLQAGTDPKKTISINVGPNDNSGPGGRGGHLLSQSKPPVAWTPSPPLSCSGTPPCGYLVLTVYSCTSIDPASCPDPLKDPPLKEVVAASTSIGLEMADMADFPSTTGFFLFHIELKNQDGTPAVDASGKKHPADLVVEMSASCGTAPPPPLGDAGKDGAPVGDAVAPPPPEGGHTPDSATTPSPDTGAPPPDAGPVREAGPDATIPVDASGVEAGSPSDASPVVSDSAASG